jgi:SAM-dependent methyltransferase
MSDFREQWNPTERDVVMNDTVAQVQALPLAFDRSLSITDRAVLYNTAFPRYPAVWADKGWLLGMWNLGNDYRGTGYHGAYPPSYLKRVEVMFPEVTRVLHLFSGSLLRGRHVRVDRRVAPSLGVLPDICADAEALPFSAETFDLILADPPYSGEDATRYGAPMVDRRRVFDECVRVLVPGGNLVWLDMVHPMYRKRELCHWGEIGIVRSTNHRYRLVTMFERR